MNKQTFGSAIVFDDFFYVVSDYLGQTQLPFEENRKNEWLSQW